MHQVDSNEAIDEEHFQQLTTMERPDFAYVGEITPECYVCAKAGFYIDSGGAET
jgi:hypothetical protein